MTGRDRASVALAGAVGQIGNGGLAQYVDNGVAHRTPEGGKVWSCVAAGALVEAGRSEDAEVADRLILLLRGAATARNRDDFRRLVPVIEHNGLGAVEREMFALGHDRIDAFLSRLVALHPVDADPFDTAWRPAPMAPFAPSANLLYPNVVVDASTLSGNANAVIGAVSSALRRARVPDEEIEAFRREARSGDYDKVLATMMRWVTVEMGDDEPEIDEDDPEEEEGHRPGGRW